MYQLLFTLKRTKGIQVHVFDKQEDFIHLLHLNPESIQPREKIPSNLRRFLTDKKTEIQSGKYMLVSDKVKTRLG